jgi:dipeptidyl-peptidase-3
MANRQRANHPYSAAPSVAGARRTLVAFAALVDFAALCSCSPAPAPRTAAVDSPRVEAPAAAPVERARRLEQIGEVLVVSYPPAGFDRLTPEQRVLAYHLSAAALAGDPLFSRQTSPFALPAQDAVRQILSSAAPLDPALRARLVEYRKLLFVHHGLHDKQRSRKFSPPLSRAEFEQAARSAGVALTPELLAAMFDPTVLPMIVDKTPGAGRDPIQASASTHYDGVTREELEGYEDEFPLNGRVVKRGGKLVEEVYRAGDASTPPGAGAAELARVVEHLTAALPLAPPEQRHSLELLIEYFRTGDNEVFRQHDIAWLGHNFPVDYIFGFIETYLDPRQRKGSFEAFVAIPDPAHDPPLQALAHSAAYFEQKLPWPAQYKRDVFRPPATSAATVLAATGDAGPFTFGGVNLPNPQELRQRYGTKNFITASVVDARQEVIGDRMLEEFAPEEDRAELIRCRPYIPYATIGFHEVTGHGSGKVEPTLKDDPARLLAPSYSTMEEGRADLVADYLTGDPKTIEIGVLPDAGCARIIPAAKTTRLLTSFLEVPVGDRIEEDHVRAGFIELGVLRDQGAIVPQRRGDKTYFVVPDPAAWRAGVAALLAEHQRIKATGDRAALAALVEKYGTQLDTSLRDEVVARHQALHLPERIATVPPLISAVRDDSGQIRDARAEQVSSLDDYIAAFERESGLTPPPR